MNRRIPGNPPVMGVEQEIRALYDAEAPGLLRYAIAFAGTREAAQDAVQEAFFRFFVARSGGQDIEYPRAWLYRVLRNHILDEFRAGARDNMRLDSVGNLPGASHDPEDGYCRFELLRQALKTSLSPRENECVRLRIEGLRYVEIGAALRLSSGTVGALLARAHKKIRQAMGTSPQPVSPASLAMAKGKGYAS